MKIAQYSIGKFLYLLVFLLIFLLISTITETSEAELGIVYISLITVLIMGIYVVSHSKILLIIQICLVVATMSLRGLSVYIEGNDIYTISNSITCLFFFFTALILLIRVMNEPDITADTIYAALSVYLLIGLAWGYFYTVIEQIWPGTFAIYHGQDYEAVTANPQLIVPELIYFSFVTLSTLGYGDIVPIGLTAKSIACLEAIIGQLFLVVLIARLVGIHVARSVK